jgi:hypothetical protein
VYIYAFSFKEQFIIVINLIVNLQSPKTVQKKEQSTKTCKKPHELEKAGYTPDG